MIIFIVSVVFSAIVWFAAGWWWGRAILVRQIRREALGRIQVLMTAMKVEEAEMAKAEAELREDIREMKRSELN